MRFLQLIAFMMMDYYNQTFAAKQVCTSPKQNATSRDGECKARKKRIAAFCDDEQKSEQSAADSGTSVSSTGIVYSLFQAQFRSVVQCPVCHKESCSVEPFLFVPLPLPDASPSLAVSATVVRSHPSPSVLETCVNVSCAGCVRDIRVAVAAAVDIPASQVSFTSSVSNRPHRSIRWMRYIAADGVAWSFSLSVGHDREPCKNG